MDEQASEFGKDAPTGVRDHFFHNGILFQWEPILIPFNILNMSLNWGPLKGSCWNLASAANPLRVAFSTSISRRQVTTQRWLREAVSFLKAELPSKKRCILRLGWLHEILEGLSHYLFQHLVLGFRQLTQGFCFEDFFFSVSHALCSMPLWFKFRLQHISDWGLFPLYSDSKVGLIETETCDWKHRKQRCFVLICCRSVGRPRWLASFLISPP